MSWLTRTFGRNQGGLRPAGGPLPLQLRPDLGEFTRALPCFGATGEVSIGLNANYLLDALRFIDDERVVIQLEDDVSPMVVDSADGSLKFVVMPMRL